MKIINKTLCDFTKNDLDKFNKELRLLVRKPKYICKKCFRACSEKELLCKPNKL